MKPVFWLVLLFILISGLSAWIGNDWGRRIGKRKLSVFTLRPKHTSSFLTILLSMSLSLGGLGLYLLCDPAVREALLTPESREERELDRYQHQMAQLSQTLQTISQRPPAVQQSVSDELAKVQTVNKEPSEAPQPAATAVADTSMKLASRNTFRPQQAERPADDDFDSLDLSEPEEPAQPHKSPARFQQAMHRNRLEQQLSESALPRTRRQYGPTSAEAALAQEQTSEPLALALLEAPVFEWQVYGGRSPAESEQIIQGVLALARAYAENLGLEASEPLQLDSQNLANSREALAQPVLYTLEVQAAPVESEHQALPIRLTLVAQSADTSFDPHQLLEQDRLDPQAKGQSLQLDLNKAILALAHQTQADFVLDQTINIQPISRLQTARLPIQIVQLYRNGNTLFGQIVLP